eukprot:NODE_279_length_1547_cov_330.075434_g202_i0.p3 GENE.NODE_279_length_1547_cov_330.075434_g202_i0~~NODE_279_length_1547_cov_330.075434_g202_i0.p3  ORF type:complete len:97 (+),score=8.77 NODE_279_length_1547_cov_330.075434_g202_i0:1136-1426(+)
MPTARPTTAGDSDDGDSNDGDGGDGDGDSDNNPAPSPDPETAEAGPECVAVRRVSDGLCLAIRRCRSHSPPTRTTHPHTQTNTPSTGLRYFPPFPL